MKRKPKLGNTRVHIKRVGKLKFNVSVSSSDSFWNAFETVTKILLALNSCKAVCDHQEPPKRLKDKETFSLYLSIKFSNRFEFFKFIENCDFYLYRKKSEEPSGSSD